MDKGLDTIILAVLILVFIILGTYTLKLFLDAKNLLAEQGKTIIETTNQVSMATFRIYNDTDVKGVDVIYAIKTYAAVTQAEADSSKSKDLKIAIEKVNTVEPEKPIKYNAFVEMFNPDNQRVPKFQINEDSDYHSTLILRSPATTANFTHDDVIGILFQQEKTHVDNSYMFN